MSDNSEQSERRGPWLCKSEQQVYDNNWISVSHHEVVNPGGSDGIYGVVNFKSSAVGVVALNEKQEIVLVRQYRYTLHSESWEIPEGGCPAGESPADCAARELQEETGYTAGRWQQILQLHMSNSVTDEAGRAYLALDLLPGKAQLEESESDLEVALVPFKRALEMIDAGKITDALSVCAILKVASMMPL